MKKIFGTDGVRGITNGQFINPLFLSKLAFAISKVLLSKQKTKGRLKVVIAKDTRRSGYMIESILSGCFMSFGINPILVGPTPTSSLPILIEYREAHFGIMISASHNEYQDNGIKIFDQNGFKIDDSVEKEIESVVLNENEFEFENYYNFLAKPQKIERLGRVHNTVDIYVSFLHKKLLNISKELDLSRKKIVIDCANGSGYKAAEILFRKLGADVTLVNNDPDGFNINKECGATSPERMCEVVKNCGADLGIALDGDADRIVICDENGEIVDNDKLMVAIARYMSAKGILRNKAIAVTILSNNNIENLLVEDKIKVYRTPVGDKYITQTLKEYDLSFGGEKSGHLIFSDYSKSGDGILAGAIISLILKDASLRTSEFFGEIDLFPQVMKNISYSKPICESILEKSELRDQINSLEKTLGNGGRILVRKSGTENKIRVLAEGESLASITVALDSISVVIESIIF